MKLSASVLTLSPTDLANHLACDHLTNLDLAAAHGRVKPPIEFLPLTEALRDRGLAHEKAYIDHLASQGLEIVDLQNQSMSPSGVRETSQAMKSGAKVIVQAPLAANGWVGRADILRRVETPSALGAWSYEPADTKLAAETKGSTIVQLCSYVEMLRELQGIAANRFHVITPGEPFNEEAYRFTDFAAYFRRVRDRFVARVTSTLPVDTYPEPVDRCDICRWFQACEKRRRDDDHLSFIAGASRTHREELVARGFPTLAATAAMPLPLAFKPSRGGSETYARIREQARLQHEQRTTGRPVHELLLPVVEGTGLARLPEPSVGDIFLDLEGARYARPGGREYLFGIWGRSKADGWGDQQYVPLWGFDDPGERQAFEAVMDRVADTLARHPGAHIYHFGHYEPSAFKRLMGRYVTRGEQLDELLRGHRFVDLHTVVRQSLRAGVESYSIKQLEQFYGFTRDMPLGDASMHLHVIEMALEGNVGSAIPPESLAAVQAYNRDDCRSTAALRDWLEKLRAGLEASGTSVPRPVIPAGEASDPVGALEERQREMRARLLEGLPLEASQLGHASHPRWLLAYVLDWHRREAKSAWWEHYRLCDLTADELFDESQAIAGLEFVDRVEITRNAKTNKPTGSVVDRYRYPEQDAELGKKGKLSMPGGERIGELVAHDRAARLIDIKKSRGQVDVHPPAVFEGDVISTVVQQEALLRFASAPDDVNCGTDLLFRRSPRLTSGPFAGARTGEPIVDCAVRLALEMDRTTLAIQGPPGSGKTYVGAQMIRALAHAGKRVGVTAVSHKVIRNLLEAVAEQERGTKRRKSAQLRLGHREPDPDASDAAIEVLNDNAVAIDAVATGEIHVLGGTSWLWSREEAAGSVDVLFVDEAGQMSLANALAVSGATSNMVLLGDPQQLEQPQKGTHPDGVDVSALHHVLGGASTMPPERGLFLPTTWRLHPAICAFTSELFYEGKLESKPGLEHQSLRDTGMFDGAGLWFVPVEHDHNDNFSLEEVNVIAGIVERVLAGGEWLDERGRASRVGPSDIRIVAAFNAQVNRLAERLDGHGVPVGTVDKFQGQEAPVVIYSMATSRPEDAPRGMEFLYSLNRLNVATSRARCAAVVVASPRLLSAACRTPRQMQLANALCRYVELSHPVNIHG